MPRYLYQDIVFSEEIEILTAVVKLLNLSQLISSPTRITKDTRSLIDVILTTRPEHYVAGVISVSFSDHCVVYGIRKLYRVLLPSPKIVEARNYKHYNPTLFREDLGNIPWEILNFDKPDDAWQGFKDLFLTTADKHALIVTR